MLSLDLVNTIVRCHTMLDESEKRDAARVYIDHPIKMDRYGHVYLDSEGITDDDLLKIKFPEKMVELHIRFNRITNLIQLFETHNFSNLKCLNICSNPISSLKDVVFPNSLTKLAIDWCNITSLENAVFGPNLTTILMNGNHILEFSNDFKSYITNSKLEILSLVSLPIKSIDGIKFPQTIKRIEILSSQLPMIVRRQCYWLNSGYISVSTFNELISGKKLSFYNNIVKKYSNWRKKQNQHTITRTSYMLNY